jgi:PaaX-like protein
MQGVTLEVGSESKSDSTHVCFWANQQGVTLRRTEIGDRLPLTSGISINLPLVSCGKTLEHNQLKIRVLKLIGADHQDSHGLQEMLKEKEGIDLSHRAVEMALLRYWRQGLLKRERKGRRFTYVLSPRGVARRNWLESQAP